MEGEKKEQQEAGDNSKRKKIKKSVIIPTIVIIVLFLSFILDKDRRDMIIQLIEFIGLPLFIILCILIVFLTYSIPLFVIYCKEKKWFNQMKKILKFIGVSLADFFGKIIVPFLLFILILLGAVHGAYPYESNMSADLNNSFRIVGEVAGSSLYKLYSIGDESPNKWFLILSIIFLVGFVFFILDVICNYKKYFKKEEQVEEDSIESEGGKKIK